MVDSDHTNSAGDSRCVATDYANAAECRALTNRVSVASGSVQAEPYRPQPLTIAHSEAPTPVILSPAINPAAAVIARSLGVAFIGREQ